MSQYTSFHVFGSVAYDELMTFPGAFEEVLMPDKLDQLNVSFVVSELQKELGGTGTNIAYNLSLVSQLPVHIVSGIGSDGDAFRRFFRNHGIQTDLLQEDQSLYTATGKATTDRNNNQVWSFYYGACKAVTAMNIAHTVSKEMLCITSANDYQAFLHVQRGLIEAGVDYVYDPAKMLSALSNDELIQGINGCRWLISNEYEMSLIEKRIGKSRQELVSEGTVVITTRAQKGVEYIDQEQLLYASAYPHASPVDPTGAGDAWMGGFLSAMVAGLSIGDCLKQGNALASFAIEQLGALSHKPSADKVAERAQHINVWTSGTG